MSQFEHARKYLHECGFPKEQVYVTGSPMAEVLHKNLMDIERSDILKHLKIEPQKYGHGEKFSLVLHGNQQNGGEE